MTLAKRLVPCLDVDRGRVVKGVKFVSLRDAGDPVECAARYDAEGADELVFLDITASSDARPIVLEMARRVADTVFLPFTVGGGVRSVEDADALLRAGADKVAVNTAAGERPVAPGAPEPALRIAGDRARPSTRARCTGASGAEPKWEVFVRGGRTPTGRDAVAWAREGAERGAGEILLTSMDRDGTKDGFDVALNRAVAEAVTVPVIRVRRMRLGRPHGGSAHGGEGQCRPGRVRVPFRRDPAGDARQELRAAGVEVRG
jgi:cyclase